MKYSVFVLIAIGLLSCKSKSDKKPISDSISTSIGTIGKSLSVDTFHQINDTVQTQPKRSMLVFPNFSIILNNFEFFGDWNGYNKFEFRDDTTLAKFNTSNPKLWTVSAIKDTISITTLNAYPDKLEILSQNKTDRFEVSYSFKVKIVAGNGKDGVLWETMMPYKKIKDSLNYFFNLPVDYPFASAANEITKKLKLKDTTFREKEDNPEYGTYYMTKGVIFKNKIGEFLGDNVLYYKIDRFRDNKIIETKYFSVYFNMEE